MTKWLVALGGHVAGAKTDWTYFGSGDELEFDTYDDAAAFIAAYVSERDARPMKVTRQQSNLGIP